MASGLISDGSLRVNNVHPLKEGTCVEPRLLVSLL